MFVIVQHSTNPFGSSVEREFLVAGGWRTSIPLQTRTSEARSRYFQHDDVIHGLMLVTGTRRHLCDRRTVYSITSLHIPAIITSLSCWFIKYIQVCLWGYTFTLCLCMLQWKMPYPQFALLLLFVQNKTLNKILPIIIPFHT